MNSIHPSKVTGTMMNNEYWIRVSVLGYAWVIFPVEGNYAISLHIPQTDDVALFCVLDSIDDAKQRIDMICGVDTEPWTSWKSQKEASKYLRDRIMKGHYRMFRHGLFRSFPFVGVSDRTPGHHYSKLALLHGLPTDRWPAMNTVSIWTGLLYELDEVVRKADSGQIGSINLLDLPMVRASVTDFFRPLTGRHAYKDLRKYLDACLDRHFPELLKWKNVLYDVRNNRCAHLGEDSAFGIAECRATRTLVSLACEMWAQGNVPLEEQAYRIDPNDVEALFVALFRANAFDQRSLTLGELPTLQKLLVDSMMAKARRSSGANTLANGE